MILNAGNTFDISWIDIQRLMPIMKLKKYEICSVPVRANRKRKNTSEDCERNERPLKRQLSDPSSEATSPISPTTTTSSPGLSPIYPNSNYSESSDSKSAYMNNNEQSSNANIPTCSKFLINNPVTQSKPSPSSDDDCSCSTDYDYDTLPSYEEIFSPPDEKSNTNELKSKCEKTPHATKKRNSVYYKTKVEDTVPCYVTSTSESRLCPLPMLTWAKSSNVWDNMCRKDERASLDRDANMFENHPGLQPRMRAILLDWLIEVCEVYKLHRETYYLTVDYLDRYLSTITNISKNQLQLIGITCLFIASKVEEVYPPKLTEFAYVTDAACTEEDILQQEVLILQALQWCITPVTIMGWVSTYMQLTATNASNSSRTSKHLTETLIINSSKWNKSFIYPQFTGMNYTKIAQLVDLCSLDVGLANFPYSIIAAAAVSHIIDQNTAIRVSGLDWASIAPCAKWMEPYFQILDEENEINPIKLLESNEQIPISYGISHVCPNLNRDHSHIIQTHTTSLELFDKAFLRREQLETADTIIKQEASPAPISSMPCPPGILTPPASSRKEDDCD